MILSKNIAVAALTYLFLNNEEINIANAKKSVVNHYQQYQAEKEFGVKKASFELSNNGFIRYRRTGNDNKVEYFSVKMDKILNVDYLGTEKMGWLVIKCLEESVIYQTYQDNKGNVDDMIAEIKIPIKNIDITEINVWVNDINNLKASKF
ncbi:hypothetical protein [Pedobacter alpinus]|uniref:Uncharacterized protein n=1 Tax=Pedobacter alpinus TaxID=1590643 RepID=A0ABW5TP01_9SPHI